MVRSIAGAIVSLLWLVAATVSVAAASATIAAASFSLLWPDIVLVKL